MRSYLTTQAPTVTIRGSEHAGTLREARSVYVFCEIADGITALPAVGDAMIRVEVHTNLALYASFTTATADHYTLCGTIFDLLMDDALATSLTISGLTIQGVHSGEEQSHRKDGWTLINTMSRLIRAVPQ